VLHFKIGLDIEEWRFSMYTAEKKYWTKNICLSSITKLSVKIARVMLNEQFIKFWLFFVQKLLQKYDNHPI
jgi:hypothetical protein